MAQDSGSVTLTADGVIGRSGQPVRIFNATQLSGGTAGILVIRGGATDTSTIIIQKTAPVVSNTDTLNFENGLYFPNGAFFDKDTNVTSVTVEYRVELA